jgi:hypothetical protein
MISRRVTCRVGPGGHGKAERNKLSYTVLAFHAVAVQQRHKQLKVFQLLDTGPRSSATNAA